MSRNPSYQHIESEAYRLWRECSEAKHQNNYDLFVKDRDGDGYDPVLECDLKQKIGAAIFGTSRDFEDFEESEQNKVCALIKQITGLSYKYIDPLSEPPKQPFFKLAIIEVFCFLNDDKMVDGKQVVLRVPRVVNGTAGTLFIDQNCRTYESWDDYLNNNTLPKGRMSFPKQGIYKATNKKVDVDIDDTPACSSGALDVVDALTSVGGFGGCAIGVAGLVTPIGAPILVGAAATVALTSGYGCVRGIFKLADRAKHHESLSPSDEDARNLWIDVAFSGACSVIGGRAAHQGYVALTAKESGMLARMWKTLFPSKTKTMGIKGVLSIVTGECITTSHRISTQLAMCAGMRAAKVIIVTFLDRIQQNNWSDLKSFRNFCCLVFNIIAPVKDFIKVMEVVKSIVNSMSSFFFCIIDYIYMSMEYLYGKFKDAAQSIKRGANDLLKIICIGGRFMIRICIQDYQDTFKNMRDSFNHLLGGKINQVEFGTEMKSQCSKILMGFKEAWEEALHQFHVLHDKKKLKDVFERNDLSKEDIRKYFLELDKIIVECQVDDVKNAMKMLTRLVNEFLLKVGSSHCPMSEFCYRVRFVCAKVKRDFSKKYDKYERDYNFEKSLDDGDDFNEQEFNQKEGITSGIQPQMHFFKKVIEDFEVSELVEEYRTKSKDRQVQGLPSFQSKDILLYVFVESSHEEPLCNRRLWEKFRDLTGQTNINDENASMKRQDDMIMIQTHTRNTYMKCACFCLLETELGVHGMLIIYKQE